VKGPTGVRGRNSDNHLIKDKLGWAPSSNGLHKGLALTFRWIESQIENQKNAVPFKKGA
jgi:hypothetical protein